MRNLRVARLVGLAVLVVTVVSLQSCREQQALPTDASPSFHIVGNEGCTPGYWKNHLDDWVGYTPDQSFYEVFDVVCPGDCVTLLDALNLGGGGDKKLARHGTAALLNAAHPDVSYALTVAQVIAKVQEGGEKNAKDFAFKNEKFCPLSP